MGILKSHDQNIDYLWSGNSSLQNKPPILHTKSYQVTYLNKILLNKKMLPPSPETQCGLFVCFSGAASRLLSQVGTYLFGFMAELLPYKDMITFDNYKQNKWHMAVLRGRGRKMFWVRLHSISSHSSYQYPPLKKPPNTSSRELMATTQRSPTFEGGDPPTHQPIRSRVLHLPPLGRPFPFVFPLLRQFSGLGCGRHCRVFRGAGVCAVSPQPCARW